MRGLSGLFIGAILIATAVAGCLDGSDDLQLDTFRLPVTTDRLPGPSIDLSNAIDPDHDGLHYLHAVPELHQGSYGLSLVGYNPLTRATEGDGPIDADSAYIAIDTWGPLVCVAHFAGTTGAAGGVTIVDIGDPADPVVLANIASGAVDSDCQFTDDGRFLILATYLGVHDGIPGVAPPLGDLASNGLSVYDVREPSEPKFLFRDVQGTSGEGGSSSAYHNVFTAQIDGAHYIFQTYTGHILRINDDATGLEMVSTLEHANHDFWVGNHPITGEWVVVTGADAGTAVFNIDDPADPVLLGVWEGDRDNRYVGWHRQWPVENTIDGRAYLVVAGEECGNGDSLPYQVLDWTDPAAMEMTGTWWIPGKPRNAEGPHLCEMNSHEFEVWDGYVASGNYHAGVWVFDVGSPERTKEPATIGYYLPSMNPQLHGGTANAPFVWSPNVWGAYFDERGYIITADWWSGLYVLAFGATHGTGHDAGHDAGHDTRHDGRHVQDS